MDTHRAFSEIICAVLAAICLAVFSAPPARAQGRVSDKDLERMMKNLRDDARSFRPVFDSAIKKSTIRKTSRAKDAQNLALQFERQSGAMLSYFRRTKQAGASVSEVEGAAQQIAGLVSELQLGPPVTSRWERIQTELRQIAGAFGMTESPGAASGSAGVSALRQASAVRANYPLCPAWNHVLTFVNDGAATVHIKETPGCYASAINEPPFNGSRCWPLEANGGFDVAPGAPSEVKVTLPSCWSGNFGVTCASCAVQVQTLAEFTFDGGLDANGGKLAGLLDTYDVSLVDGFTKAVRIAPDRNVPPSGGTCVSAGCNAIPVCPAKLQDGDACLSPNQYVVSHTSEFTSADRLKYGCICSYTESAPCTAGPNNTVPADCVNKFGCSPFSEPGKSHPESACCPFYQDPLAQCSATSQDRAWDSWAVDYIATIHKNCPGEYAWQYDDEHGTFTCEGTAAAPMNYTVTISPGQSAGGAAAEMRIRSFRSRCPLPPHQRAVQLSATR